MASVIRRMKLSKDLRSPQVHGVRAGLDFTKQIERTAWNPAAILARSLALARSCSPDQNNSIDTDRACGHSKTNEKVPNYLRSSHLVPSRLPAGVYSPE